MFGGLGIACIPVENAARKMADRIIERLMELGLFPFTLRDPIHYMDLLMQDFLKCLFVEPVIGEGKEMNEFVLRNRVDNIRHDMIRTRQLTRSHAGRVLPDSRMNVAHDMLDMLPSINTGSSACYL